METSEFQKNCAEIVGEIDEKYSIKRDAYLSFIQLIEEIGELAKDINFPRLRKKEIDKENLEMEFADVILQLAALAKMYGIDFEKAVENKKKVLKERHNLPLRNFNIRAF